MSVVAYPALKQSDLGTDTGKDTFHYEGLHLDGEFYEHDLKVELIGSSDRGAIINIWSKEKSTLHHIWSPSDDGEWMKLDEVHFMYFSNAVEEFKSLINASAVLDLQRRNA